MVEKDPQTAGDVGDLDAHDLRERGVIAQTAQEREGVLRAVAHDADDAKVRGVRHHEGVNLDVVRTHGTAHLGELSRLVRQTVTWSIIALSMAHPFPVVPRHPHRHRGRQGTLRDMLALYVFALVANALRIPNETKGQSLCLIRS